MRKKTIRTVSLVVITLTYLIIGAAVFDYLESGDEKAATARLNHNISIFKNKFRMNDTEFDGLWENM